MSCEYCVSVEMGKEICSDTAPCLEQLVCTRKAGHSGKHVARGAHHCIAAWENLEDCDESDAGMANVRDRLQAACKGHPSADIPWPHRLLHDADTEIKRFESMYKIAKQLSLAAVAKNEALVRRLVAISTLKGTQDIVLPDGRRYEFNPPDDIVRAAWKGLMAAIDGIEADVRDYAVSDENDAGMSIDPKYTEDTTLSDIYECLMNGVKCPECGANATGLCVEVVGKTASMRCVLAGCQHKWDEL